MTGLAVRRWNVVRWWFDRLAMSGVGQLRIPAFAGMTGVMRVRMRGGGTGGGAGLRGRRGAGNGRLVGLRLVRVGSVCRGWRFGVGGFWIPAFGGMTG